MLKQKDKQADKQLANQMPIFIDDKSMRLLIIAESIIDQTECANHCRHHVPGRLCRDCPSYEPSRSGYLLCDGYMQAEASSTACGIGEVVA